MVTETELMESLRDSVALVIPCYNAGNRLFPVVEAARRLVDNVIVVDDGSTDGAVDSVDGLGAQIAHFPENRGKGYALLEGFRLALGSSRSTCVAVIDADGQHDPSELPVLYRAFAEQHADLVIGARRFEAAHVPWPSRVGNLATITVMTALLGQRIPDTQSGYRLHSRRFLEDVLRSVAGGRYETETEILVKAVAEGYTVISVPIQTIYETGNPSSHFKRVGDSLRIYARLFRAVWKVKTGSR